MTSLTVDTDHGVYDVLPAREVDGGAPGAATHAVYHESGALAGFASESGRAWNASLALSAHVFGTLAGAVSAVADADRGFGDWIPGPGDAEPDWATPGYDPAR